MAYKISQTSVTQITTWIEAGRGVKIWRSVNLSNPGKEVMTPARFLGGAETPKPCWDMGNVPIAVYEKLSDFCVQRSVEVKRFHVAVRQSRNGPALKVTDGGTRRIESQVEKAGKGAYYIFDYSDYNNAVIMKPEGEPIPLDQFVLLESTITNAN
jgi:hypothetical protein